MIYEVISEIKNRCGNNQMRDVFFEELEIGDPDQWIRERESGAQEIRREDIPHGIRYHVNASGLITVYDLTEAE